MEPWRICIDTGGTFTDCWAIPPGGNVPRLVKVLSSGRLRVRVAPDSTIQTPWDVADGFFAGWSASAPSVRDPAGADELAEIRGSEKVGDFLHRLEFAERCSQILTTLVCEIDLFTGEEAPVIGTRILTGAKLAELFPSIHLRLATTRGTNALLERKGAPAAFFVTRGFGDLLEIRDQRRTDLFALNHRKPQPLHDVTIEVDERLDANGEVLEPIRFDPGFREKVANARGAGIRVAAVALMHGYANPAHERSLAQFLREAGFDRVSLSSDLAPLIKILPRAETAVVDATLTPVMSEFLNRVAGVSPDLLVMTGAGGLEAREAFRPKDSLFSGPAGGVVGAAASGRACSFERLITFDMGGTSTDVARYDGKLAYQFEQAVGDAKLLAPALRIETVAAGGGSICRWTEGGLRVGPQSAGADPGPACYGRGGPLTITDVNLLLGRIDPEKFGIPLSAANLDAARTRLRDLIAQMGGGDESDVLTGLLRIAVEQMADSIRTISIREGADPADYALLAFGGAGPLHACDIAELLGMSTIVVPAEAGVLSALGLHHAAVERIAERQILRLLGDCADLASWLAELRDEAGGEWGPGAKLRRQIAELRLAGQDSTLDLEIDDLADLEADFRRKYAAIFGYEPGTDQEIELVALRVVVAADDGATPASVAAFTGLKPGEEFGGPRVIQDAFSTLWLKAGWRARVHESGALVADRTDAPHAKDTSFSGDSAVGQELFRHRFQNIVGEMGAMLQRSATSTNVKERLDFSCALLDAAGQLVANAPHIPVHLGALGLCVREVTRALDLGPGDMAVTNHPSFGGSHLPDVTVISPVFDESAAERIGYVANRAHHAEIGGIRPGSMPPNAQNLDEEGVVIAPMRLFRGGVADFDALAAILTESRFPTRNLRDNLADIQAQAAANLRGVAALESLAREHGVSTISGHLEALAEQSRQSFRIALQAKPPACETAEEKLDDGTKIRVSVKRDSGRQASRFTLDFTGTSPNAPTNLSATPAIVRSAVLYCLRLWTGSELPLNEGLLRNVDIILPRCFLNPDFPPDPRDCPAVVGGNVETSQRLVDTILKLFGIQACSQGTMNNFIFGNERFGYYETIAGGAGAGPDHPGASALHTHMTNTAITDPEILEQRYPVRLRRFQVRQESGGAGRFRGGDGVVREFEFLEPLEVSLLMQHRVEAPYGLDGGEPGALGRQTLIRANGEQTQLSGHSAVRVEKGERIIIETPGGGGYGSGDGETQGRRSEFRG